jgi:hypothetical protein
MGKGRLLTVDEVMKMDGHKVLVEDDRKYYESGVFKIELSTNKLLPVGTYQPIWTLDSIDLPRIKIYEYIEEPRTYKTSEMIAMLEENPKLRFITEKGTEDEATCYLVSDEICVEGNDEYLYITDTWQLIEQPKEVDFMTAVKDFEEDNIIYCEHDGIIRVYKNDYNGLLDKHRCGVTPGEIIEGKWYIGDRNGG